MRTHSDAIFFCHGAPGSAHDADLLKPLAKGTLMIAPDMLDARSGDVTTDMIEAFDNAFSTIENQRINVVGFSIGAMVAIQVAAARSNRVDRLTLISPAAPLNLGAFLPDMAGKPIFDLAINRPRTLKLLTKMQAFLTVVTPNVLINQLFRKCGEMEKGLLTNTKFRDVIKRGLENSFRRYPNAYINLLQSYVSEWSADISRVTCPVEIWHGDKDTWSPISMSHALCKAFSNAPELHVVQNAEHYSTLVEVLLNPERPIND